LLIFCLSCFYIIRTSRLVIKNEVDLEKHFGFTHTHEETRSSQNWWSRLRKVFSMTSLKELWTQARSRTRWNELFNQMTPHEWKYEADEASSDKFVTADKVVSTDKLWSCYANSGQEQVRWARIVPLVILYVFAGL